MSSYKLRRLAKALIARVDATTVKKRLEFLPDGDIRTRANQWVRAAFRDSGLRRVPRENQVREALYKVVKKCDLRFHLIWSMHFCKYQSMTTVASWTFIPNLFAQYSPQRLWKMRCWSQCMDSWTGILLPRQHYFFQFLLAGYHWYDENNYHPHQKKIISIFAALSQSKAFRCHQVLLNHAKNHRKGRDFVSPNAKKAKKVKEMSLDCSYVVGPLFSVVSPTIILFSQLHRFYVPRKSVDDMDTLPMPDFDLENMILECIPSRGQSLAWNFTCSFTPEHVAAYTCIHKHTHLPWPNEDSWWMPCGYCNLHQNPFNMFGMVCCRGNMCCLKNINIYVPHKWVE